MSHAQILVGEAGLVYAHAQVLAKGINCLSGTDAASPCGQCRSCKAFDGGNHPDTFYVEKTKQGGIGVDDVRSQIVSPMSTKPFGYKHKVFIINKAETLTPAAQSALLKTIEEPAPYGFFLFLAPHTHLFLPTILSRCHVHKIGGQGSEVSQDQELERLGADIVATITQQDTLGAFQLYRQFEPYKENKEALQKLLDIMYRRCGQEVTKATEAGQISGAHCTHWMEAISAISQTKTILAQNGNMQLGIELMLAKMAGSIGKGQ